jgi:N-acyl-D-aspartate/D-glutamate deacylase
VERLDPKPLEFRRNPMKSSRSFARLLGALVAGSSLLPAAEPEFDLIIRGGRVIDGTGNPWFNGDVAIKEDRIVHVGRVTGEAKRVIDANGLVVAPGFIDIHSHSDWLLLEDGSAQGKIRQGVTTEMLGESISVGPFKGKMPVKKVEVGGREVEIRTVRDYFATVERAGIALNVATYVGQGQIWECVMGTSFDRPTAAQIGEMKALVDEAMRDGAFGLSTALLMPPSSLARTEDLIELAKVVRTHGGIYSSHIRDEGFGVFDAVKEAIRVGEEAGVPVDIIHIKIAEEKFWGRMKEVLALIEEARKRGVTCRPTSIPIRAATMTSGASSRRGRTRAATPCCSSGCAIRRSAFG